MGVPCGDMNGVLLSDADPNVAALDISDDDELKFGIFCPVLTTTPPGPITTPLTPTVALPWGKRCRGRALPELCRDLIDGTGVLRGDINGLADGLCGKEACLGDIGWKLKWRFRVAPGLCPGCRFPFPLFPFEKPFPPPLPELPVPTPLPLLLLWPTEVLVTIPFPPFPPVQVGIWGAWCPPSLTPIQEPVSWTISGLKLTLLLELKEFPLDDAGALSWLLFDKAPIPLEGGCPGAVPDYSKKMCYIFRCPT